MFHLDDLDLDVARQVNAQRGSGDSLCVGCKHSRTFQRRSRPYPVIYCRELYRHVPPDIVECSEFVAIAALTLEQMSARQSAHERETSR